jgi:hypothetical protein
VRFLVDENGTEGHLSPSSFGFFLLIIIPRLLHTHLSPPLEVCASLDQAAHYHVLRVTAAAFHFSGPERGCTQNNEVLSHPSVNT